MNKKVTSILSYCTIIGWLIAFFAGDRENAKFHLNQGLILGIVGTGIEVILSVIGGFISIVGIVLTYLFHLGEIFTVIMGILGGFVSLVSFAVGILISVLIVIGILNAVNDKEEKLPVIGKFTLLK